MIHKNPISAIAPGFFLAASVSLSLILATFAALLAAFATGIDLIGW